MFVDDGQLLGNPVVLPKEDGVDGSQTWLLVAPPVSGCKAV